MLYPAGIARIVSFGNVSVTNALAQLTGVVLCSILAILCCSKSVLAEPFLISEADRAWSATAPPVRVGIDPNYAPYSYIDRSGAFRGLSIDIFNEISRITGLKFEMVPGLTWPEIVTAAQQRSIDVVATMVQTDDRLQYMNFTDIYIATPLAVMGRKGDNRILSQNDLNGRVVALVEQYSSMEKVLAENSAIIPKFVSSPSEGLKAVASSEADAYVGVLGVSTHLARQLGLANLRVSARYPDPGAGQRIASRTDMPELGRILQSALNALDPVFLSNVFEKWVPVFRDPFLEQQVIPFELTALEKEWLAEQEEISIGTMNDWPPMDFVDNDGNPRGIGADFIRALNRRLGGKLKIIPGQWTEIYEDAREGRLNAIAGITPTEERAQLFDFTSPYVVIPHTIFAHEDAPYIADVTQLKDKRIAIERGFFIADALRTKGLGIEVLELENTRAALDTLIRGEADAYVGNRAVAIHTMQEELITGLVAHSNFDETKSTNAFASAKGSGPLVAILEKALNSLTLRERRLIFREWVAPDTFDGTPFVLTPTEKEWLAEHPVIRVAADRAWQPIEFVGTQGVFEGVAIDMLDVLEKMLDVRFEFDYTASWDEAVEKVKVRELDMFSAVAITPSRQEFVDFTAPYASLPTVIFSRRSDPVGPTIEELSKKRVAAVRGYAVTEFLKNSQLDLEIVKVDDVTQGLRLLSSKQVDAYIGSILVTGYVIRESGLTNIVVSGQTPYGINVSMAVRNDWPVFTKILRRALAQVSDQQRSEVLARWLSTEFKEPPNYQRLLMISAAMTVLFFLAGVWIWILRKRAVFLAEDLRETNHELRREMQERIAAENTASVASKAKSEFLANISHEFRTPLNAIVGYIELIRWRLRTKERDEKLQSYTENLNTASVQLKSLVDETLDLVVIEEESFTLNETRFAVSTLFSEVKSLVDPAAQSRAITIAWQEASDIDLVADCDRLRQVLINIVDNAIKYSHEGGRIAVSVDTRRSGSLSILVEDSGIGMNQATLDRVLRPFTRGDDPFIRSSKGVGLGLAICERLVRLHGGQLKIESTDGQGTRVIITLPRTE